MYTDPPPAFTKLGAVRLRSDVYPARVAFSFVDAVWPKARSIVTTDHIYILVDRQGEPGLLYDGRLEDFTGDRHMLIATTADGEITITRAGGCGCGSRLKTYKPYQRAVHMATV